MSNSRLPALGTAERAVYHLVEAGQVTAATAGLYRRELRALAGHGLVTRTDDGGFAAVLVAGEPAPRATPAPSRPPSRPYHEPPAHKPVPMQTLVARVPAEWLDMLDARGPDRSTALREVLGRALAAGSGLRKAAGR
jgi:hypothetical protein